MTTLESERVPRSTPRVALACSVTLLILLLVVAGITPAWSMSVLPLVVASSELSPLLVFVALGWLLVARRLLVGRRAWRNAATAALAGAAMLALRPIMQFDEVAERAAAQLGDGPPVRFSLPMALTGLPAAPDVRERVVRYAAADGTPLAMRLFESTNDMGGRPAVVVLYGGAWRGGEPMQGANVSRALAQRGYVVAAIDYRHAPRFIFPAQLDDVRRSLAVIRDSASAWKIDTARIALLGRSAGGHLATLAAYAPGGPRVQAVIAIYAPWNLVEGYRDLPVPDPIGVRSVIGNFVGGTPEQRPVQYSQASPSSYVRAGLAPTLLLYGSKDHLVKPEFVRGAAAALRAARVPVVEVELPWAEHGFDLVPAGLGAQLAFGTVVGFLDRELGGGGPR